MRTSSSDGRPRRPDLAEPIEGFCTFGTLRTDSPERARSLVDSIGEEVRKSIGHTSGLIAARLHVSLDGTTVVNRVQWESELAWRRSLPEDPESEHCLRNAPGVVSAEFFGGVRGTAIQGPAFGEAPEIAVIATRHLSGHEAAQKVADLLVQTGTWKQHSAGFISATPYVSLDGRTYVNYPQWTSREAYESYMADPRLALVQEEIARFEVAPPQFVLCRVFTHIGR